MVLMLFKRPSHFMGIIVFLWSVVVICTGFVNNFAALLVMRILLGIFEYASTNLILSASANDRLRRAGFFPGAILIISKWYLPYESQTRIAIFFTASAMAGAFSGLLAYAIAKLDGVAGYGGWRWVRLSVPHVIVARF